ncbi:DoxX family protein [Flavobacteriaceae bacterium]|nr:DoxX family protein [Flavobacteriaceae bacterium]
MKALIPEILQIFSALSFVFYGIMSFSSNIMKSEFNRWGISKFRTIVGCVQLTGGFGLLVGFYFPIMTILSSLGLTVLMLLGFILRLIVKDGIVKSSPAFIYTIINLFILLNNLNIDF